MSYHASIEEWVTGIPMADADTDFEPPALRKRPRLQTLTPDPSRHTKSVDIDMAGPVDVLRPSPHRSSRLPTKQPSESGVSAASDRPLSARSASKGSNPSH